MRVDGSERAVADLSEIRDHIAEDSEAHAITLLERLLAAVENLEVFPDQGRRVPEARICQRCESYWSATTV
jgi:plasmid stabilization system protein ParE